MDEKKEVLKPCKNCGNTEIEVRNTKQSGFVYGYCDQCKRMGRWMLTVEAAIELWDEEQGE
jgi:late competence protein required for DNA uptake (superfamily II DNA/RNA helicase)